MRQPKFNRWDWALLLALLVVSWGSGLRLLLAAIVAGLYFSIRPRIFFRKVPPVGEALEEPYTHEVGDETYGQADVVLDVDMRHRPCKNHFRYWASVDTSDCKSEFEYKIEGTEVFIRLLEEFCESAGQPDEHAVIDGIVQETTMRERQNSRTDFFEDRLESLKASVEWHPVTSLSFNGLKYVVLSRLNTTDSRRFLRQELERVTFGSKQFKQQLLTLGYPMTEKNGVIEIDWKTAPPENSHGVNLAEALTALRITLDEFLLNKRMTTQLRALLDGQVSAPSN